MGPRLNVSSERLLVIFQLASLGFEPTTCRDPKHYVHESYALPTELVGWLRWALTGLIAIWAVLDLLRSPRLLLDWGLITKGRGDRLWSTNRAHMITIDSPWVANGENRSYTVTTPSEATIVTMYSSIAIRSQWSLLTCRQSVIWLLSERECPHNHQTSSDLRWSTALCMSAQSAVDCSLVERGYNPLRFDPLTFLHLGKSEIRRFFSTVLTLYQTTNFLTGPDWKHLQTTK